jgi:hypothetical protein
MVVEAGSGPGVVWLVFLFFFFFFFFSFLLLGIPREERRKGS